MPKKRRRKKGVARQEPEAHDGIERTDPGRYMRAAGDIPGWGTAAEVLDVVTSVRTVFPDFNRATTVGGLPVRRMHTVHGPTHGGKTAFALGLVKSFVDVGFLAGYVDAEHALGQEYAAELVRDLEGKPNFKATRPTTYEKTIDTVDAFLSRAEKIKAEHPDHRCILVVDTINKLVPERELKKILAKDGGGAEVSKGHHGRYRAAINQAWLDQMTPRIARADCALVVIAQERDAGDSGDWFNDEVQVKGGQALVYDASLLIRVSKAAPIFLDPKEKSNASITGFAHRVRIWKSKVGHMDGNYSDCVFHLSNGKLTPAGFDTARDAVSVGVKLGIVKQAGAWYSFNRRRKQGLHNMVKYVGAHPPILANILDVIAEKLDKMEGRAA